MVSRGAKTQAVHLGQPTISRVVQRREKNDPRQNVTEEYDSHENTTGRPPDTFLVVPHEGTRRSYTSYTVHTPNTTVKYDCESYFLISYPPKVDA